MAQYDIITGQYVRISQTPASIGERMLAQVIDWCIQVGYLLLWIWIEAMVHFSFSFPFFMVVVFLPMLVYCPLCEIYTGGQTVGKNLMKMRVVKADGSMPSPAAFLLRWLLAIVDGPMVGCVGVVVMAFNRHNQRIGDLAASTVVVKQQSYSNMRVSLDDYDYLTANYHPAYLQAADLTLDQADVIKRALDTADDNPNRLQTLSAKVQAALGISRRETTDELFLMRLLRDYQYYALEEV